MVRWALSSLKDLWFQSTLNCECCEKGFTSSSNLTSPKRIHTGAKPFICEWCETGFSTSSDLNTHKRFHTGAKPFKCDQSYSYVSGVIKDSLQQVI